MGKQSTMTIIAAALAVAGAGLSAAPVTAQQPVELPRIERGAIVLDGRVDEAAWDAVDPLPLTMYEPTFRGEITERTEIRVAYDDEYLYASCRCLDASPDGIRVTSLSRDAMSGDDQFLLLLDPYDDNETGLLFMTSPAGVRVDRQVRNDAEGDFLNPSWDTFWDAAAVRTDGGWSAEIRIPLSSLRFQQADGRVVMGLSAQRVIARKNERVTFPAIEPDQGAANLKPSRLRDVVLRGIERDDPVYLTPYLLGGATRTPRSTAGDPTTGPDPATTREWTREVGLDAKYALASNLTLDMTLNTDFAQVEADDEQVNLTRFSLFFPEKRQFFQERSGIFDIRTGAESRLFHSRRIGLTVDGEPVRILGGGRLVGRLGGWDVGVLDMQTDEAAAAGAPEEEPAALPSENFGVLRLRRRVLNQNSFAGGMFTSRVGADGDHQLAYGVDASLRLSGEHYLSLIGAHTLRNGRGGLRSGSFRARFADRSQEGLGYRLDASRIGRRYDPGIGFVRRRGVTVLDGLVDYGWFPGAESPVRRHAPIFEGFVFLRNGDGGGVESAKIAPNYNIDFKSGATLRFEATLEYEDLLEPFAVGAGATIPADSHWFPSARVYYRTSTERRFGGTVYLRAGDFYDGHRVVAILRPHWWASPHLELSGRLERRHLWFPDRDETFTADLVRLRVRTALDTRLSASVFAQYNGTADALIGNIRFRYNFAEGNDVYLVFDEALDVGSAGLAADGRFVSTRRAVLVKYTHTFAF
ncbi:MAG: DUF5916 domain-containing protein [Gemmatimonadota bacterium]